ncbi:carbamoyltransferase [Neisseria flavescens]|nr:carbamoyltransferase [Neisseria flavescens]
MRFMACWIGGVKQRPSETVFLFSDSLLAQTLEHHMCVRSTHILLVEFRFHMGYGLLIYDLSIFLISNRII